MPIRPLSSPVRWLAAALLYASADGAQALSLYDALAAAERQDPAYARTLAEYDAGLQAAPQTLAALRPALVAGGTASLAHTEVQADGVGVSDDYPAWSVSLEARQALFRLDWSATRERADVQTRRAGLTRDAGRLDLQVRVAEQYFNVLIALEALDAARAQADAVRRSLDDTRRRYEVELVPGTDLKEAQARDDLARSAVIVAERQLEDARDLLADTVGEHAVVPSELQPEAVFPALLPEQLDAWLQAAHDNSPLLADAREQLRLARADYQSSRAAGAPTVDLVGRLGRDDSEDFLLGQQQDDARLSLEVSMPLYTAGATRAAVRAAEAGIRAAQAELQRVLLDTERNTRQAFRALASARVEAQAYAQAAASARIAEQAVRNGYEAGTRTIADLLDAQAAALDAERNLAQTRYAVLTALVRLKYESGVLDRQDFRVIDALLVEPAMPSAIAAAPTVAPGPEFDGEAVSGVGHE